VEMFHWSQPETMLRDDIVSERDKAEAREDPVSRGVVR
jgi:hypothetical protein